MKGAAGAQAASDAAPRGGAAREARPASLDALVSQVRERLGAEWLPEVYRERIMTMRTRSHPVPVAAGAAPVEVLHTLLGIELKVGRRRVSCPDLATARYLSVFARLGVGSVAVPYDITKISRAADELESAWQRTLLLADHLTEGRAAPFRSRVRAAVRREVKREVEEAGAGAAIPQFNQNTRQRPRRAPSSE
ncbi:MAG TPA: hypothetical protein VGX48_12080 [Pyrinomonadaceae bacterium]|jgi:hypothetical protein|nr:hypothetical protein [Pyrinomonadaceae bacterium]